MRPAYFCLAGPTASGKSAASMLIAQHIPVEIISVDSALVYRGMDIGTAKPSAAEQAQVPHHLIDILDPSERYSAAQFVADATRLIGQIQARGKLPLLVGGTMLYFKALQSGLDAMPPAHPQIRAQIDAEAAALGWPALHAQLARVDPVTAARLSPNDSQRVQRALEVFRATGKPLSSYHTALQNNEQNTQSAVESIDKFAIDNVANLPANLASAADAASSSNAQVAAQPSLPAPPAPLVSLEPLDRAWLHQRIAQRFKQMIDAGLVAEVAALRQRHLALEGVPAQGSASALGNAPALHADMPSMRCVGYRQTWQMLDGEFPPGELHERCIAATRQLAKRQITWLRSMPQRQVVACDQPQAARAVLAWVQSQL